MTRPPDAVRRGFQLTGHHNPSLFFDRKSRRTDGAVETSGGTGPAVVVVLLAGAIEGQRGQIGPVRQIG